MEQVRPKANVRMGGTLLLKEFREGLRGPEKELSLRSQELASWTSSATNTHLD